MKPDSLDDLSVQVRLIWLEETAVATRFEGTAGRDGLAAERGVASDKNRMPAHWSSRELLTNGTVQGLCHESFHPDGEGLARILKTFLPRN